MGTARIPDGPEALFQWVRDTLGITDGAVPITMETVQTAALVEIARTLRDLARRKS